MRDYPLEGAPFRSIKFLTNLSDYVIVKTPNNPSKGEENEE